MMESLANYPMFRQPDKALPRLLLITGHARSGTSLITRILNRHPQVKLNFEFENFLHLNVDYETHINGVRKNYRDFPLVRTGYNIDLIQHLMSAWFLYRYRTVLKKNEQGTITPETILGTLHHLFPQAQVVGDKKPLYIYELDALLQYASMNVLIIYRDPRDVVRSVIQRRDREGWYEDRFSTTKKIAQSWVNAINIMEQVADKVALLRYEDLVEDPAEIMRRIGDWLGLNPSGFLYGEIDHDKVRHHKAELDPQNLQVVLNVAGTTMARLGYDL